MLGQVPEFSMAQGDGALPVTFSSGSSPGGQSGLAEIAASTGFADQSHLSRWVRRVHGVSPHPARGMSAGEAQNLHDNPSSSPQTKCDWSHLAEGTNIERFAPSQEHCRRPNDVCADPAAGRLFNASRPETIGY